MWKPKFIRFKNLLSHTDTTYEFHNGVMTMFLGENSDDSGSNSNGAGKSTVIEAITLAITGDVYRGVGKEDYIKYETKSTMVDFELRNDVLNQTLNIKRTVFTSSKSAKIEVFINGEFPPDIPTATNGGLDVRFANKFIFDTIGITKEDFLNYYVIGQGNHNSFFTANDTKQKEIISRFSNFTAIDNLLDELSLKDKELQRDVDDEVIEIAACDSLIEYLQDEIETVKSEFSQNKTDNINSKKTAIKDNNDRISKIRNKIAENEEKLLKKQSELSAVKLKNVDDILEKISQKNTEISQVKRDIRESERLQSSLDSKTENAVECPACSHKFIPDDDIEFASIGENLEAISELIKYQEQQKKQLESDVSNLNSSILLAKEQKSKKNSLNNEITSYTEIISEQNDNLNTYLNKQKILNQELLDINKLSLENEIQVIKTKLNVQEEKRVKHLENISKIQDIQTNIQFHSFHFGKKGFKTYLANKSIRSIQDMCNFYLQKFETNLQVQISGFTVLKSGEVRDKIEISVLKNGISKGLFNKYSGGEKSRIDVAGIISINKLINNGCGDRGLDLLILDENISYLDSKGQEEIIKILSKSKITTLLVMHQVDNIPYKNKVFVKKINGNSVIV